ncbi:hypothetical protein K8354_04475 [Polaribacter litorisediminis]|uniref:DUF6090 family protein n=1 Tax=Polaribacter litorisediminis TaxID=1908341 RepID=UPI001CBE0A97|nr:DUF6090 family protein [Polaribacter litorisediminis]UAM99085.1 hypothetical protein K8354_04470 [Polaribacter litorisediminis]UAM99086.1 hypothetical protein K8354_04475 [Polaribacter litorisediminis]
MENKTGKYFKYAIGEIVLVMIGILLALQVSNWNQERKEADKEQLLLEALHQEFLENRNQLDSVVFVHERSLASTQKMISRFPINIKTVNLDTLSKSFQYWGNWSTFNPSQGVIKSLVNSSTFELISNPELRVLLVSWEDVLADYKEEEDIAVQLLYDDLFPELASNIAWRSSGLMDDRFDKNYLTTFNFENLFLRRADILRTILGIDSKNNYELLQIKVTIDRIIELSRKKTNDKIL